MRSPSAAVRYAVSILKQEARAIQAIVPHIGKTFDAAVELCRKNGSTIRPTIVVSGIGKSGIVAQKLSSTFGSVGIPSWYLHPAEVAHGDIGRLAPTDVCILISNSGETPEVLFLASLIKREPFNKIIVITANAESSLAKFADVVLPTGAIEEAGNIKMIPTSSTTAVMALGDALVLATIGEEFTVEDYRYTHPGGNIGRRLSKVDDVMRKGNDCAVVAEDATILQTIMAITKAQTGAAIIVNKDGVICGIFTDGDLRRAVEANDIQGLVAKRMTRDPMTLAGGRLVDEAIVVFNEFSIGELPIVDADLKPIGMLALKDIIAGSACSLPKPADPSQAHPPLNPSSEA